MQVYLLLLLPIFSVLLSERIAHLQLNVLLMAGINHGRSAAYGVAVKVTGGAELCGGSEARSFLVGILQQQVTAYAAAVVHAVVVGIEESAFVSVDACCIVGIEGGESAGEA